MKVSIFAGEIGEELGHLFNILGYGTCLICIYDYFLERDLPCFFNFKLILVFIKIYMSSFIIFKLILVFVRIILFYKQILLMAFFFYK